MNKLIKSKSIIFIGSLGLLLSGCSGQSGKDNVRNNSEIVELTHENIQYETAMFYKIDFKKDEYVAVKEVRYYVNEDTLFTSERYYSFHMYFSDDDSDSIVNMNSLPFDINQKLNKDGWYYITLGKYKDNIKRYNRLPNTRLSAVVLRSYYNGELDSMFSSVPNAVLFNSTKTMAQSRERNKLDRQLQKLLPYIE